MKTYVISESELTELITKLLNRVDYDDDAGIDTDWAWETYNTWLDEMIGYNLD